jgi:hypothetical protein
MRFKNKICYNGHRRFLRIDHPYGEEREKILLALLKTEKSWSSLHYVKTSNMSCSICNGLLTLVTCNHIYNGCYLANVTDKHGNPTPGLASATLVTNVDFW